MPPPDPRRFPPERLIQLLNSDANLGTVISAATMRKHRLAAGLRISSDGATVDVLKYVAWLCVERHSRQEKRADTAQAKATPYRLEKHAALEKILADRLKSCT